MQDPQPKSIIDGLKEFYSHYDSGNMPTDEQLNQLATNFAGREAELWSQLYGHYEKAPVGEDVINSLVTGFANPFAEKKKASGGDASSLPGGSNPPLIDQANPPEDQEPVQDTPKTDMLSGAVANAAATGSGVENTKGVGVGAASAVSTAIRGTQQGVENPEEFESPEAIDFNNLYDTSREERQAEELAIEVSTVVGTIDPFLLAENPTSAIQLLNDGLRSEYRPFLDYLAETPDPVAEGEFYMRGLNQIAGTDRKTVREFEATVGDQMVEAFEELKETLGPQRARVRELQAVIESAQDPAMVQQAQTELQSILSDEGYQQGEQLYQSYIDDFGFGPYQESIERMYAAQLAQGKLQEQYPEFFQEMEARESQQKVIDQMAAAGMRPNPRVPGTFRPEILRFGDFSFYQQIEAPFVRTMTESIKSIAATPGIVMSAFGAEQVGYGWAKSVDRMINVDEMVPVSSNVQRGLRETVGKITVDGNDYQVVVEDGEPIGVRDKDGYLVYGSQKEKILTEWNNSGGEATKKFNWGQVLPIVSSGTAQMVGTILLSRGISSRANLSSRFQQQMVGAGTMTAQIINQQYQMAIDELGPENADLAARYALASSLLISSVNLATNPIEAGITTSIGRQSVKTMQRNLAKGPMGAYRAGMLQQASLLAQNVARYSKGVVTEGIEGLSEQGVDQAVRMMTQTSSSPNRRMDVDLSLDGFYNSFLEEALGTMFAQMAFTPRANFHQEALYQAYQKPEVLDGLDKDAQKHYRNVFTKAQAFFGEAGKISEEGQAEVLSAIDAAERIASAAASAPKTSAEAQNYVKGIVAAAEEGAITDATFQEVEEAPSLVQIEKSRSNALSPLPGEIVQDGTGRSMEVIEADASGITFTDGQVEHTVSTQEWEVMVNSIFDAQVSKHHPGVKQQDQAMLSDINKRFGGPKKSVAAEFDETVSSVGHSTMDWVAAWFSGGGRLTRSSMSEADDPVKVKEDRSTFDRQFFHETKGDPVDMAAMWVAEQAGITEAEAQQAIVDFVNQNRRTGVNQYMRDRVEEVRQAERGTATQRATVQQVIDEYNGDVSAAAAEADKAIAGDASTDPIMLGLTQDELVQLQQMRGVEASGEPLVFTPNDADVPDKIAGVIAATGATVMVHTSPMSLPAQLRGMAVSGAYDPKENVIHINSAFDNSPTIGHEGAHVLLRNAPAEQVTWFYNGLVGLKGGKAAIKFAKKYGDPTKPEVQEEAVAEYLGRVIAGDIKIEKTFWQTVLEFFSRLGFDVRSAEGLRSLAEAYATAVKTKEAVALPAEFNATTDGRMRYRIADTLPEAEKLPDHDQRVIQAKGIAADYAKTANTTILTAAIADTTGISMAQAADIVKAYKEAGSTKFPGARQISRAFWKVMHLVGIDKTKENNFLQGWLLASRGLDANILKYNELRLGTVARYTERGIKRAQKADQLLRASDIPNVRDLFDQYMRGDTSVASQLGDELTAAAQGLRASLDNIIQALIIEGHVSGVNAEVLAENLGKHLTRAFRIHYDDKYKPTDDIKQAWINKEAQRLYKKYVKQGVDPAKAQDDAIKLATNRAERLLAKHKEKPMKSGSSASKDVGIFKRRKQLPKELEELIAEAQASGKLDATERHRARELIVGQEIEYAKKTIPARIVGKKATREAIQRMLDEGVSMPGFENMPVRAKEWVKLRLDEANDLADRAIESILTGDVGAVLNYLDKETRDLLGEYSDPIEAYLFTMQRTVTHLATARYLQSVAALGQGRFVWNEDDPEAPERAIPFASEGSRTLSPLNGKVVLPEYVDYIKQVDSDAWINDYEGNPVAWTYRTMLKTMQVVNYMKTILSPATQSKNVLGGVVMSAANGNLPLIGLNEFVKDKRNVSQWISTMKNYGLLGDNISYRALKEGLLDKDPEKALAQRIGDNVWKRAGRFAKEPWRVKGLEWTYAFGDDMFKAASFIQEASQLSWALFDTKYSKLSADQRQIIDEMAAERVKNTYPNYSRIGEAGKYLSKNVFMGQFIAFQAEAIRTQANILMYAMNDILSPNNKVKALGFKRLLGFTAVFSARYFVVSNLVQIAGVGATGLMGMLFGDDEDRELEKDYRLFVLDHQTNHELIPLKADDGSIRYIDLGSADPYGTTVAAIKAATMTDNPNEAAIALVKEMLLPFFGRTIIADLQNSLANNKDVYGNRIYTNANTFNEKVENMFWYAVRVAGPGAYNSYVKVAGADEDKRFAELIGQLTGIKVYNRTLIGDYSPLKAILRESVGGYGTESVVTDTKYFAKKIYAEQGYEAALDEFKKRALPGMDRAREAYLAARKLMSDDAFLAVDEMVEDVVGASKQSSPAYFIRHYIQTGEWVDPNESFFQ